MERASSAERGTLDVLRRPEGGLGEPGPSGSPALRGEQEPRFLRVDELGDLLRVSRSTAYAMVASGLIPSIRLSPRVLRVDRARLEHWLTSRGAR